MVEVVYFAHGQESGPWGTKIQYLAECARGHGLAVESPDFSHSLTGGPREEQLVSLLEADDRQPLLVGSSMGSWVACRAAAHCPCSGLFLMASAFDMPGHPAAELPNGVPAWLVHGWNDDIVPPSQSLDRARKTESRLTMVADGHRLAGSRSVLIGAFDVFLRDLIGEKGGER